jgi:hypothetical protein
MLQSIILPVAVIAIILIGVLGVVLMRRGRRAADEFMFAAPPEDVAAVAGESPVIEPEVATQADPRTRSSPGVDSPPMAVPEAPAYAATYVAPAAGQVLSVPETAGYIPPGGDPIATQAKILVDPLGTVILDMVDGRDRLTGAELKRLDVFRPERIELAVKTLELPPRLRDDEDAVLRAAQIQLYAATLALRSKWSATMSRGKDGASDVPYSARDFKLKMARDIMELPAPDRSEVIGFLLGGLLNSPGSTPDLKRAVIDTVEHLHSASLANVLLDCLDDPDPIVQEYALAAADRLLDG